MMIILMMTIYLNLVSADGSCASNVVQVFLWQGSSLPASSSWSSSSSSPSSSASSPSSLASASSAAASLWTFGWYYDVHEMLKPWNIWTFEHSNIWRYEHLNIWTFEYLIIWTFVGVNNWNGVNDIKSGNENRWAGPMAKVTEL